MTEPLYCRSARVQSSVVGDRVVLFHRDLQATAIINPSGSRIWDLLDVPLSEKTLAENLLSWYPDLSFDQALADVSGFLANLMEQGLISRDG